MEISVGTRIRNIRGTESRASFADKFGIGTTTLQRYENDERSPELDFLMKLQSATGYSLDYLVYGRDSFLPSDEKLLLDKYRQVSAELKNKILMLLLSGETTPNVVNDLENTRKNIENNDTNQGVDNSVSSSQPKTKVKAEKIGNNIGGKAKVKINKMEF